MTKRQVVTAFWDDDAQVWVALSEDIPGLTLEGRRLDAPRELVDELAPEVIEANRPRTSSTIGYTIELSVIPEPPLD